MINLSLDELKLVAKNRDIKDYESKSKEDLIKYLANQNFQKDFSKLRHKFSKKEIDKYRKTFYDIKNYRDPSASEIKEAGKNLAELKDSLGIKQLYGNVDSIHYDDLDNYGDNYDDAADDDKYQKIGSIKRLFQEFDRDYYKPIRTDNSFDGKKIAIQNIRAKEIDMKIFHQKSILI